MGYFIVWLWIQAVGANPWGVLIGTPVGVVIGAFLANYFLGRILATPWLILAALVAAWAGGYIFGLAGGFLVGWAEHFISRFN